MSTIRLQLQCLMVLLDGIKTVSLGGHEHVLLLSTTRVTRTSSSPSTPPMNSRLLLLLRRRRSARLGSPLLHQLHQLIRHVVWCRGSPLLQNGVVRVCAGRATVAGRPVRLRPDRLPGAGGRVFPELALLPRRRRSPR